MNYVLFIPSIFSLIMCCWAVRNLWIIYKLAKQHRAWVAQRSQLFSIGGAGIQSVVSPLYGSLREDEE